ncbi:GPI transamidase component PIG-S-like isoform X1 [Stylophora pistillata]|uniref:GPI transamidase component PIG-S n=1 Tax=Stylophora pistillata TaxID=50429 RepID=A0A2B4RLA4_STYPI|nr:GPI transamidase component PIG-S-like isoform X1 [Stylophora pistillata]PFX17280.1 GPI transamidase component PIG-S [Stylophora pistillata]
MANVESDGRALSEKRTQAFVSLSVAVIFICIGLPLWWNTTKVYRASLPYDEIEQLNQLKVRYVVNLKVVLFGQQDPVALKEEIEKKLNTEKGDTLISAEYRLTVARKEMTDSSMLTELKTRSMQDLDDYFQLQNSLVNAESQHYSFFVLPHEPPELNTIKGYVGKHFHSILFNDKDSAKLASVIMDIVGNIFVNEQEANRPFNLASKRQFVKDSVESMRAQKSTTGLQVSFTLLNSDPDSVLAEWDIEAAVQKYLDPFLLNFPHLDITVDSQVLHYSSLQINPKKDGKIFSLHYDDLPHMINPIEGKLGSHISLYPSLNFVVYVPSMKHSPIYMKNKDGELSSSNAFLSPQWGGIMIYNLPPTTTTNNTKPQKITVEMKPIMNVFLSQLKLLLGMMSVNLPNGIEVRIADDAGVTKWEQESLMRLKTMEYLATSTITLTSLAQLLGKISNMVINDHIQQQVEQALGAIRQSTTALQDGNVTAAVFAAKSALRSSEEAFFDPSILELLYFPDDQKYAIYIPLFLPISLPVLLSLRQAVRWYRGHDKDGEKDKDKDKQD